MAKRKRREFTAEQKAEAIRLIREAGSINQVGRDLHIHPSVLIRVRGLEIAFAEQLDPMVRERCADLWHAAQVRDSE